MECCITIHFRIDASMRFGVSTAQESSDDTGGEEKKYAYEYEEWLSSILSYRAR
jgi:hypothetical protein